MSRYRIPSLNPSLLVTVGWDAPLGTFFLQVENPDAGDDGRVMLWIGTDPQWPYADLEEFLAIVGDYGRVSTALREHLAQDQAQPYERSPLQEGMVRLLRGDIP
jgi:hypothetical protein